MVGWVVLSPTDDFVFIFVFLLFMFLLIFKIDSYFLKQERPLHQTSLSDMPVLLEKIFGYLNDWATAFPNTYFVAMVTPHSGTTAKAIEDKLPICHMLALLPYVLISDTRFMCTYEQQLRYYFFIPRCRFISPMTCLFTNICLISLLPWLQRSCPSRLPSAIPQSRTAANWLAGDRINLWTQRKIDHSNGTSEFKCERWLL